MVWCRREFSVRRSSIYAQARSTLGLFTKAALLGLHKAPSAGTDGRLGFGAGSASLTAGVDVGIESGAFHFRSLAQAEGSKRATPILLT